MTSDAYFEVADFDPPGVPVVNVGGEIDVATSPELHELLADVVRQRHKLVVVNLTDVSFIDSTGLGVLVRAVSDARASGGDLRLVVTQPHIIKLLELTGLDDVFQVASSMSDAVRT